MTGKCNAACFYCPAIQNKDELPSSQGLSFDTAASYAEYLSHFKFKGVSFSGGEPLLFKDRLFDYLQEIRKVCSPDLYVWMYTNGILADQKVFSKLASFGLNEVRFDIGATAYSLEKIRFAAGIIDNITIEIPAVPEEKERIIKIIPDMVKAGVRNLNLHQLRLTEYNAAKLTQRGYTFIPAEKPVVLESEIAALEIIDYARKNQIDIGINYCSFFFKNRFQTAGFRNRVAGCLAEKNDHITSKGYIRKVSGTDIQYNTIRIADDTSMNGSSQSLKLKHKNYSWKSEKTYYQAFSSILERTKVIEYLDSGSEVIPSEDELFQIWMHEYIEEGIREY